jgi:Ca-activated chloride channel family protein
MEKKEIGSKVFTDYKDRFQWFLGIALLLLIIESLLRNTKNKWSNKINLFEENEK